MHKAPITTMKSFEDQQFNKAMLSKILHKFPQHN